MNAGNDSSDRRGSERVRAFLAVELSSEVKRNRFGVTRNASSRGLLIITQSRFTVGELLEVCVRAPDLAETVRARVVRVEATDAREPWPFRLALALDAELPPAMIQRGRDIYEQNAGN